MAAHSSALIGTLNVVLPRGIPAIWSTIRKLDAKGPWAAMDVADASHAALTDIKAYTHALVANGYAEESGARPSRNKSQPGSVKLFRLKRQPANPPRFDGAGRPARPSGQQQMWNAMRAMSGGYDYRELALAASTDEVVVSPVAAHAYLQRLMAAGYLAVVKPAKPGTPAIVRLKPGKNTGPLAPQVMRTKFVWDANLNQVVGTGEPAEEVRP